MRTIRLLLLAALSLLGSTACGKHNTRRPSAVPTISLTVDNHYVSEVRISIVHDGLTTRVGSVAGSDRMNFILRPAVIGMSGHIQLVADPVAGSGRFISETIAVKPGEQVAWTLETRLERSSIAIY